MATNSADYGRLSIRECIFRIRFWPILGDTNSFAVSLVYKLVRFIGLWYRFS